MINVFDDLPIIACSTGLSENTAIGLIRISGFDSLTSLQSFFDFDLTQLKPNYVQHCKLIYNGKFYDDVVITFFKGPRSYNSENILEISAHGNIINLKRMIDLFISNSNIRLAHNGEFTYRALVSGKLTLSQVEGLDALLNATNTSMLDQGLDLLHGSLYKRYLELAREFKNLKSNIELNIDFLEDIGVDQGNQLLSRSVTTVKNILDNLCHSATVKKSNFLSPNIVFFGKPNAGKSSLFNELLKDERAIVSGEEGTTRDYLSEPINLDGNVFNLIDTAGLRDTDSSIEKSGIDKAKVLINESFIKFHLIDFRLDLENELKNDSSDVIIFTHTDCEEVTIDQKVIKLLEDKIVFFVSLGEKKVVSPFFGSMGAIQNIFGPIEPDTSFFGGPIEPFLKNGPIGASLFAGSIGPANKASLFDLFSYIILNKFRYLSSFDPILIDRQRELISEISYSFDEFYKIYVTESDIGILSSEINLIDMKISRLIGITTPDDVLGNIFSNFCIGK